MVVIMRKRKKFIRRCLLDIWGDFYTKRFNKIRNRNFKYFKKIFKIRYDRWQYINKDYVYQTKKIYKFPVPKLLRGKVFEKKALKGFYLNTSKHVLKFFVKQAKSKMGSFVHNLLVQLEGQIYMMVYRAQFETNLFKLKALVRRGLYGINFQTITNPVTRVSYGDWVCAMYNNQAIVVQQLLLYNPIVHLKNLYINYFFLFCFYYKKFNYATGLYPINITVMRALDYLH